ncbi:hypothetical protein CYY_006493 [Polysphondylium violaceum]|uniref:Renin receptor N-terminal domain-containing protein n=1 Tax=Polysphondylium violaceum TaxID=133409 RepID=A0A8J4URG8_9MYCE|nr:hypothetical protein CYY_006493 [Polysphondylium violaceum]
MRSSIILFFVLAATCVALAVKSDIKYFENRSGDIILEPSNAQNSLLFLKGNVFGDHQINNIADTQISNLISHVMGLLPLNANNNRKNFPSVPLFNKPKLNLLFTVDSVSQDDLVNTQFLGLNNMVSVEKTFFPLDNVAESSTIATGVTPDMHGIVSSTWVSPIDGQKIQAFNHNAQSLAANMADVLSQTFGGRSLIVSASADYKLASAHAVHKSLSKELAKGNHFGLFLNNRGFQSLYHRESALDLINKNIESVLYTNAFKQFVLAACCKASMSNGVFTIVNGNQQTIKFNFDEKIDRVVLSELVMLYKLVDTIKNDAHFNKLAADSIPDMLSFSFASLSNLRTLYGADSLQFVTALKMIDNAMQNAFSTLSTVYGDRVACEAVTLAPQSHFPAETREKIVQIVGKSVNHLDTTFPHFYLKSSARSQKFDFCQQINAIEGVVAHCVEHLLDETIDSAEPTAAPADKNTSSASSSEPADDNQGTTSKIALFQIFLFFPIVWVCFVVGGILYMMGVSFDANRDTLLYRSTERQY